MGNGVGGEEIMVDECEGCCKEFFADNWVDFVNWCMEKHPEYFTEFRKCREDTK